MWTSNFGVLGQVREKAFSAMSQLQSQALASASALYTQATTAFDTPNLTYIDVSALPTVKEIMAGVQDIVPDQFPTAPTADEIERYKRHVWQDTHLDSLLAMVMSSAESGGLPTVAMQDAIFDQDRERKQKTLADSIDIIKAQTSGRGFKYANGQTNAAILDLMQKHQMDLENQSREITKLCEEWARQNFQFSIEKGIGIEQLHMDFAYKHSTIQRELYTALVSAVLEKYRTQVQVELEKLDANTKAVMTRAEAYKANADISSVAGRLQLEKYQLDIQQNLGRFNGNISNISNTTGRQLNAAIAYANTTQGLIQATTNNVIGVYNQKSS
jgi:hypothetical protein